MRHHVSRSLHNAQVFIYVLVGTADYRADPLTAGFTLVAGLIGVIIDLLVGVRDLSIIENGLLDLSVALILCLLNICRLAYGGQFEFFSITGQLMLIVFALAITLSGLGINAAKCLLSNFLLKK